MPTVVKLKDAAGFFGGMNDAMLRGARVGLLKAAERGVQTIITEIIPSRTFEPVDRGTYRAGWKTEKIDENTVAILNPEPHAVFIEEGVRAENVKIGAKLIQALSEWALRKGIAEDEASSVGVAWAIAKAMQRKGIFSRQGKPGLNILGELVDEHIDKILKEEVKREVRRAAEGAR